MSLKSVIKAGLSKATTLPGVRESLRRTMQDDAVIFMIHRFRNEADGVIGLDGDKLRSMLARLRKDGVQIWSLEKIAAKMEAGDPLEGAVAFTMDDGYRDQGMIGGPVFAKFDCPVTTFLTTGFIDGKLWPWWDQVEYIFANSKKRIEASQAEFIERCKDISEEKKLRAIDDLVQRAEVPLPEPAPSQYQPLSWDEIRKCERGGMSFAPHSITHPVLARVSDEQSATEISGSWKRLQNELSSPVPVFAYPNGRSQDFGEREMCTLKKVGMKGAVTAEPGYAKPDRKSVFAIPRIPLPKDEASLALFVNGLERLRKRSHARTR